jgi:hypothetical protein
MDQRHKLHFLLSDNAFDHVAVVVIIILDVSEVLVSSYKHLVTELSLEIHTQSLYSVAHRIRGLNSRKILQEFWVNSHVWRLLMKIVVI